MHRVQSWRRYRTMQRRLAELDRLDRRGTTPARNGRHRLGRWRSRRSELVFVSCFVTIVAVLVVVRVSYPDLAVNADRGLAVRYPPLPPDTAADRILPSVTAASSGAHAFGRITADGRPVTYDPCRPIHYVVNTTGMPNRGLELVRQAIGQISAATGLSFKDDGLSGESLVEDREPLQERYGEQWAPVLIGWMDETNFPLVSGDVAGIAGSVVVTPDGPGSERYVTGQIVLDRDWFDEAVVRPGGYAQARAVLIHELGHLVGLDHVSDPDELMAESNSGVTELGPGDRQGLAAVGAGQCRTDT